MDKNYKELVEEKVNSSKISDDKKQKVKDFIYTIIDKKTEFIVNGKNEIEKVIAWFSDLTSNPTSTKILFEIIGDKVPKTHKAVDEYLRNYIGLDYKEKDWLTKGEATKILNDNIGKYVFISDSKRDWQKGIKSYPSKPKDLRFLVKVNSNYVVFKYENDINTYELNIDNIRDIVIDGKSSINDSKLEEIVAPLFKNEYIIPIEEKLDLTRGDVIEKLKLPKEEKREWFDSLDLTNYEFAIKVMREESLKQPEKKEELTEMNFVKEKEIVEKFNDDLEYLNNILSASQDLLDLISDTGEKEDIDFLKEKIMVTKDLISILDNNYEKGGEISTSSPYAIEKVNNWNQIPSTWKNTKFINKVNYQIDPYDDKFNSVFKDFVGVDELKPVMMGYNVDDYGVTVTDAHRLAHIPAKLENKGIFNPTTKKLIDGKYPNYENVIPTEFSSINLIDTYKLLQYCRVADKYSNKTTHQAILKHKILNDKYENIGFNMEFLISVLESALKNGFQKIYFKTSRTNGVAIISNVENPLLGVDLFFLLMPVSIRHDHKSVNNVGAMDIDYGLELSCVFDLSKNEIVNKDDSIVDFKMDYGINPIFTDEVIEIIKTSLQKNPQLPILENFKVKNGSAFLVNIKNEDYSVTIQNINVPDSLYYIKDGVAVKNDNADFDDYVKDIDFSVLNKNNSIKINKDYFSYIINIAKLYVGNDELRPVMMGINFNYDGKDLYVASTNANYLSRLKVETDINYENENNFDFTLPVNNLVALLESNEDEYITLDIYSSNSDKTKTPINIVLKSSSFILRQKLIDGRYPRVNQVIPNNTYYEINLNKKEILNAIKSKETESFIKRNKKLNIVISGKKENDRLSIILYSTSDARDEFKRIEEIEILNTDLYLTNEEIPTTDSCLLLMPMMSKREPVFSFDFKLFKEFINPVNTDNFKISYTEKTRAYIINEEFFKYEQKFKKTKKAEKIIAPKIISKIEKKQEIKEVEKEENDLEYLNNLLSVSQDLLDLVSETGEKEDIDFLKEKIEVTKDLIALLGDNYANGGGVSYPDLSKQTAQVVNDSVVLDEFSIKKNKNNFTINGFNKKIMSSDDAVKILREIWEDDTINAYEQAYILYFNKSNSLIGYYHHSNGGIDGTVMDIQMISGLAVKSLAKGVIIAHNHPSENTQPSNADKQVSEQLKTALKTFNITLLDSLIITNDSYFSFADEGIL